MSVLPVRVAVRVRPLSADESCQGCSSCLDCDPSEATVSVGKAKQFTFDFVFGGQPTDGELLYDQCVLPLLDGCFEGLNATVLAYGQTGSGKTFTMGTDGQTQGVIPKLIHDLFAKVEDAKRPDVEYNVQLSFLEIYREDIRDLLMTNASDNAALSLREDLSGSVFVCGLSKQVVCSEKDILDLITRGCKQRATASTSMNATSSRSHAIITIYIRVTQKDSGEVRTSQFHLVDLAGSERAKRTHAQGSRFKEGIDINRGLLALGNVISALGDERKAKLAGNMHIPYRDSKLTRLLQDSLGGNARTVLIACASPADVNFDETMNTLKYANRARNIKNKPKANQEADNVNKIVQKLRDKISSLEAEVYTLKKDRPLLPSQNKETCKTLLKLAQRNAVLEGLLEQLKAKGVAEVEEILLQESEEKEVVSCGDENTETLPDEVEKEHLESQLNLQTQLQKVSEQLNVKVKASEAMEVTNKGMDAIRAAYEQTLANLSNDLCVLQREREDLKARLERGDKDGKPELAKSREHSRKRLKDLEKRIKGMQQKMGEQERLLKIQARGLKNSESLKGDIVLLKRAKVKLLKQIKKDADDFRKLRNAKEREIHKLNKEKSKQKIKISKLQNQQDRQANVLKRRNEEIKAVQHRLKAVLNKQKVRREYLDGKVREKDQGRWSRQIDSRLDISCELAQLKQEIGVRIEERKSLSQQLSKCSEPNEKEALLASRADASRKISELQSVIVEAEEEAKSVPGFRKPWADIRTTSTAKAVLSTIFAKLVSTTNKKKEADKVARQTQAQVEELNRAIEEMEHKFEMQKASLQGEFDEKLLFLMQQIPESKIEQKASAESNAGGDLIQSDEIENLSAQNQRLVELLEAQSIAAKRKYLKEKKKKEEAPRESEEDEVIWLSNDSETEEDQGDEEDEDYIPTPMKRKRSSGVRAKAKDDRVLSVVEDVSVVPENVRQHVETLKVKELKAALKVVGLAISGRKTELKKRLLEEFANRVGKDKSYDCLKVFAEEDGEDVPIMIKSLPLHNKRDSVVQKTKETKPPPRSSFEPIYEAAAAEKRQPTEKPGVSSQRLIKLERKGPQPKPPHKGASNVVKRKSTEKRPAVEAENSKRLANKQESKDICLGLAPPNDEPNTKEKRKSTEKRGTSKAEDKAVDRKDTKKVGSATMKVKLEEWMAGKSHPGKKQDDKPARIGNSLFKSRGIFRKNPPPQT